MEELGFIQQVCPNTVKHLFWNYRLDFEWMIFCLLFETLTEMTKYLFSQKLKTIYIYFPKKWVQNKAKFSTEITIWFYFTYLRWLMVQRITEYNLRLNENGWRILEHCHQISFRAARKLENINISLTFKQIYVK